MNVDTSYGPPPSLEPELLQLWNKFLNRSDLTIEDDFFERGGDSLLATELLIEVERLTQATVPPSILFETGTVRRFAEWLSRRESYVPKPAVRIGGEGGRLFHFFHGDFEHGGLSVRRLAEMLGPERSLLAIAPHGIDGGRVPSSIEEMAADRLPLILEAQPCGPYLLGGHCNGALVAFEAARLLISDGHRVDLVVMIDPVVVSVRQSVRLLLATLDLVKRAGGVSPELRQRSLEFAWMRLARLEGRWRRAKIVRRFRRAKIGLGQALTHLWNKSGAELRDAIGQRLVVAQSELLVDTQRLVARQTQSAKVDRELYEALSRAMLAYCPQSLEVPVLYVALRYSGAAWRRITSEFELIDVPGHHFRLSNTSVAAIMERVRARLDALDVPLRSAGPGSND